MAAESIAAAGTVITQAAMIFLSASLLTYLTFSALFSCFLASFSSSGTSSPSALISLIFSLKSDFSAIVLQVFLQSIAGQLQFEKAPKNQCTN